MMCDCISKFLKCLEPIIIDLNEVKKELDKLRIELSDVNDFLEYVKGDITKISTYSNQDLIYNNLSSLESDETNYKAMVYLVNGNSENIKALPQYESAVNYMESIIECFEINKENLVELEKRTNDDYEYKSIAKKYYDLFQQENLYIEEQKEFVDFLLTTNLDKKDYEHILCHVVKMNVVYYRNNAFEDLEIDREQDLMKIHEIIHNNKVLMNSEYADFVNKVSKKINITLNIKDIVNEETLQKINIDNIILAKTIWLTNKISQNYKSCEFGRVSKYIKEYDELMVLKDEVKNINDKDKIIKIIKGGY